jgi:cytochrome c biogenesis protein CcmG/thiol:disulfide interchange protein DsbE
MKLALGTAASPRVWPLALLGSLVLLLGLLAAGLRLGPRELPSPLIGKPAPAFRLHTLHAPPQVLTSQDLRGQVWILNVWASWCTACREEHPVWVDFARTQRVPLYGLNYKDKPEDALRWLGQFGNPYLQSLTDPDGRTGIDWGVYGVPETFVIDRDGVVRHKQVGPVTPQVLRDTLVPLLQRLRS